MSRIDISAPLRSAFISFITYIYPCISSLLTQKLFPLFLFQKLKFRAWLFALDLLALVCFSDVSGLLWIEWWWMRWITRNHCADAEYASNFWFSTFWFLDDHQLQFFQAFSWCPSRRSFQLSLSSKIWGNLISFQSSHSMVDDHKKISLINLLILVLINSSSHPTN